MMLVGRILNFVFQTWVRFTVTTARNSKLGAGTADPNDHRVILGRAYYRDF